MVFGCVGFFVFPATSIASQRRCTMLMSALAWIVLGLAAGFIANKIVSGRGEGIPLDIVVGIVGALFGGWLFNALGSAGVTGFNAWSLLVAIVGSVVLLIGWHALQGPISRMR
jgi:uncharacterized membrane protein YeaQ/YmgE (transglycosylase-associated protein family)